MCVCVRARARACVRACVRVRVCGACLPPHDNRLTITGDNKDHDNRLDANHSDGNISESDIPETVTIRPDSETHDGTQRLKSLP